MVLLDPHNPRARCPHWRELPGPRARTSPIPPIFSANNRLTKTHPPHQATALSHKRDKRDRLPGRPPPAFVSPFRNIYVHGGHPPFVIASASPRCAGHTLACDTFPRFALLYPGPS